MPVSEEGSLQEKKSVRERYTIKQTKAHQNGEEYLFVHDTATNTYSEMTRTEYDQLIRFGKKL